MTDIHETDLPVGIPGEPEETKAPAITPENTPENIRAEESIVTEKTTEEATEEAHETHETEATNEAENLTTDPDADPGDTSGETTPVNNNKLTKEEILKQLTDLVNAPIETTRNEVELLKQTFHKIHKFEVDELKKNFIETGGDEKNFRAPEDETEAKIKILLNRYKEKKAVFLAEEEQKKAANYALKLQLVSRIKELTESQSDFNKLYNEFKEIQQRWKEAGLVPQEHANELWKNYQTYTERFYDLIKINNQFRDYDFKKNLDMKTTLCEAMEKLSTDNDTVSAYHKLQTLHQQWREIGPVPKDLREDLWARFKGASNIVNKRHQEYFEDRRTKEQDNLHAKTAICEQLESIDFSQLKTYKDWEEVNEAVYAAREQWKKLGFAPKKYNQKIYERFRTACDIYFDRKGEYFKQVKGDMGKNMELKKALCEKAEALKNNTDWKETTEKLIALRKEWKTIGSVPRKQSDILWKRFMTACDHFFEQKGNNFSSQKNSEQNNLEAKKEVIEKINNLDATLGYNEALNLLKDCMSQWNAVGFVPFKEKDKINAEYRDALDKQYDRLKVDQSDRKMQTFRSNLTDITGGEKGKGKLYGERDKLMRSYERMKTELHTYENNIGFLSVSSKGGSGLVKEMERKIEQIKEEMALIIKKIDAIDENLE
ncbi:MAG: DUF349 domain-containing protein [Tannerellaceae bacterium]|nr:DUF349 domain-containing protein [Tannerellaceae bacterium]